MGEVTSQAGPAIAARRRPWFILGVLLFVLGPALYIVQFKLKHLGFMPWYVPLLATLGVAVMVLSVAQRRGILRTVGLAHVLEPHDVQRRRKGDPGDGARLADDRRGRGWPAG